MREARDSGKTVRESSAEKVWREKLWWVEVVGVIIIILCSVLTVWAALRAYNECKTCLIVDGIVETVDIGGGVELRDSSQGPNLTDYDSGVNIPLPNDETHIFGGTGTMSRNTVTLVDSDSDNTSLSDSHEYVHTPDLAQGAGATITSVAYSPDRIDRVESEYSDTPVGGKRINRNFLQVYTAEAKSVL